MGTGKKQAEGNRGGVSTWWLLGGLALVCVVFILNWCWLFKYKGRGEIGDMFGVSAAIFSGLAFVCIIWTLIVQRDELKLQREELKLTREEIEGQKKQIEAQNKALGKQNFENTFFQLLRLQSEMVNAIDLRGRGINDVTTGRDCMKVFWGRLSSKYNEHDLQQAPDRLAEAYKQWYGVHHHEMGHYFRNLHELLSLVDRSAYCDGEKSFYVGLVRAQLSTYEVVLLFHHCVSGAGHDRQAELAGLAGRYPLLEGLPEDAFLGNSREMVGSNYRLVLQSA